MTSSCPRCGCTSWWPFDGNDVSCLRCGYVKYGNSNHDDLYANLMEQGQHHGPGCGCKECMFFRYEAEADRQRELLRR